MWMLWVVLLTGLVKGNILGNGDFESGSLSPWTCSGCQCHITDGVLGNIVPSLTMSCDHMMFRCQWEEGRLGGREAGPGPGPLCRGATDLLVQFQSSEKWASIVRNELETECGNKWRVPLLLNSKSWGGRLRMAWLWNPRFAIERSLLTCQLLASY